MYQVHFSNSTRFLNELGLCFPSVTLGPALSVCVCPHKSQPECVLEWRGDGNTGCLS